MVGGFGLRKDLMRYSKPICSLCNRIFLTPQALISHIDTFHPSHHFSTFSPSSAAAPATFRHYPKQNRNPNHAFPTRNRFDLNYYRSGYIDDQGRFHKGLPAINPAKRTNFVFGQQEKPKVMDLFPEMSSEGVRTLPLLCQLEQRRPQDPVTEKGGATSSTIDLTLRL